MSIYIISDTHFNHTRQMIEYCQRPVNYEELLVKNLSTLTEKDILIHLGDISIGKDAFIHETIIKPLKCKKILVRGNHDKKSNSWYLRNGWDFVCEEFVDTLFGRTILFSHEPASHNGCVLNIHGHLHNKPTDLPEYFKLYSAENEKYKPVDLEKFISKIK